MLEGPLAKISEWGRSDHQVIAECGLASAGASRREHVLQCHLDLDVLHIGTRRVPLEQVTPIVRPEDIVPSHIDLGQGGQVVGDSNLNTRL